MCSGIFFLDQSHLRRNSTINSVNFLSIAQFLHAEKIASTFSVLINRATFKVGAKKIFSIFTEKEKRARQKVFAELLQKHLTLHLA